MALHFHNHNLLIRYATLYTECPTNTTFSYAIIENFMITKMFDVYTRDAQYTVLNRMEHFKYCT